MSKRKHPTKEKLIELYINKKMSSSQIAKKYKMSKVCVCRALNKFNISIRECKGNNHPMWKGGRVVKTGYWAVWKPKHPRANNVGYVKEHILVMEKHLGRAIKKSEHIHHINYDRKDNMVENLWLCSNSQHQQLSKSVFGLLDLLLKQGIIKFDRKNGEYLHLPQVRGSDR